MKKLLTSICPSSQFRLVETITIHQADKSSYSPCHTRLSNGYIATAKPAREQIIATKGPDITQTTIEKATTIVQKVSVLVHPRVPYLTVKIATSAVPAI